MVRMINIKWDGPLEIDWDFEIDSLRESIRSFTPFDSGALRNAFLEPETITINDKKDVITINIAPPNTAWKYANIQDVGGFIPPYDIIKAKGPGHVMRAEIKGETRFFTKRKGFRLRGFNYIERGVRDWVDRPGWISIGWRGGPAGQGLRTLSTGRIGRVPIQQVFGFHREWR